MEYNSRIIEQFNSWAPLFKDFIESQDMNDLFGYIKQRAVSGAKVLPPSTTNPFRAFAETNKDKLKCIICSNGPYATVIETKTKQKIPVADGLAISCGTTWKEKGLTPVLEQIYNSWEDTYNPFLDVDMIHDGDLLYLAQQGVLLYNIGLTVEENKPGSHNNIWQKFNKYFWEEIINKYYRGLPIIFMGPEAQKSINYLTPMLHYPIPVIHPGTVTNGKWESTCWKTVDQILWGNNREIIKWYRKKGDELPIPDNVKAWINEDNIKSDLPWSKSN